MSAMSGMNPILAGWNASGAAEATAALLHCCAATRWAAEVTAQRPFADEDALHAAADRAWDSMAEPDWMEAFRAHPRIGERKAAHASAVSSAWSKQEQAAVEGAEPAILDELAEGNRSYKAQFGFTYIVCATGKSSEEMLHILRRRLASDRETELREAAEQQRQIMHIRVRKWLQA